jgi:hypothetical protein
LNDEFDTRAAELGINRPDLFKQWALGTGATSLAAILGALQSPDLSVPLTVSVWAATLGIAAVVALFSLEVGLDVAEPPSQFERHKFWSGLAILMVIVGILGAAIAVGGLVGHLIGVVGVWTYGFLISLAMLAGISSFRQRPMKKKRRHK